MTAFYHNPHNLQSEQFEKAFPKLKGAEWSITSEGTSYYNCIAFAAGDHFNWWDPSRYWPIGDRSNGVETFIEAFKTVGFEVCTDASDITFEYIAIFGMSGKAKHAARQMPDGTWKSKCGPNQDITHPLHALEGNIYGKVATFMRRKRPDSENSAQSSSNS